ncbi:MAG: histidinol-phosphatase [Actinobacteria bacterium]|nr:histidinol-phosphatase [Actinomycetota bacterium]NBO35016.1 histidinol-phosphatase [Actinomycetota bacterium]
MNSDLELALKMATIADQLAMSRYRALDLNIETKPDFTPVTEADRAVETALRQVLATERPSDGVIGEEFPNTNETTTRTWIIDPIDSTKNYVRGVSVWGTLIALAVNGKPQVGVVSAPAMGRRWWASPEDGAFTQDVDGSVRSISVSAVRDLADASFSFSDSVGWEALGSDALTRITSSVWRSRGYGDFWSHLLVAEGAVDIAIEPELQNYDMAAFIAVVLAAGGSVTGANGQDPLVAGQAITTNGLLHEVVLALIK